MALPKVFLAGIGWIDDLPAGNRLRWHFPLEATLENKFFGLPGQVIVERAFFEIDNEKFDSTLGLSHPLFPYPLSWWTAMRDQHIANTLPSTFSIPQSVHALKFFYHGPETLMRVYDSAGQLTHQRQLTTNVMVELMGSDIKELVFFGGSALLTQIRYLDLFGNQVEDIEFDIIASLFPRPTVHMSLDEAYQRYSRPPSLTEEQWADFHEGVVPASLGSAPESVLNAPNNEPSPWCLFQTMIGMRWEYSQLYAMGFVDGPGTPAGADVDNIHQELIFDTMPNQATVYRLRCAYEDHILLSNPVIIRPFPAQPIMPPDFYQYLKSQVQLFGEETYQVHSKMNARLHNPQVIEIEVEERFAESPLVGTAELTENYSFRSWGTEDQLSDLNFVRRPTTEFYDVPMQFRARSIDSWDRHSNYGAWTMPMTPDFVHHPEPPIPLTAWSLGGVVSIVAQSENHSFQDWIPDHAVRNTPGSTLEVLRQNKEKEPVVMSFDTQKPMPYSEGSKPLLDQFSIWIPNDIDDPEIFVGGSLLAGKLRADIDRIEDGKYIFTIIPDGGNQAPFFEDGPVLFQQAYNHPSLFTLVAEFPVDDIPERLVFPDPLPTPAEQASVENYALRVNMGILKGAIGKTVSVIREPAPLEPPPPFSVELMGIDFYDRTLIRVCLSESDPVGKYKVLWADGAHDQDSFQEVSTMGDFGMQRAQQGRFLYEIFSLPIPKNVTRTITIGVKAVNEGDYSSEFSLEHLVLEPYSN